MSPKQIAQTIGRSEDSVRLRLIKTRAIERKRKELERDCIQGRYFIKMTDFNTCKVITYKEVVIAEHENSSRAWDYTMRVIRRLNKKSAKNKVEEFYWVKYL